jgi:hypothetical protein
VSKIKISGGLSGTGVVTLIAPNTDLNNTIVLPDTSGESYLLDSASDLDASKLVGSVIKTFKQVDLSNRSYGTSWALGAVWDNFSKSVGSKIHFSSTVPMRNDSNSWGGGYCRVEYSIDNGSSYVSLGDTGYDVVMNSSSPSISHWTAAQLIDLTEIVNSNQVKFRFQHRSYDGTMTIKSSSGITDGVGYYFGQAQLTLMEIK